MKLECDGLQNGIFADQYGNRGLKDSVDGAALSPPLRIVGAPDGTASYALFMEDKDAIPVCGFSWIHWAACNITQTTLPAGASQSAAFVQGVNSTVSIQGGNTPAPKATGYDPMSPPNAPHRYEIHVFALDCMVQLDAGFTYNQLYWAMQGHILAQATLEGVYNNG